MAPTAKLTYFNATALGESIRLLLSYGSVDFEDVRLTAETFPPLKETFPYGKVPVLEMEGKTLHQNLAICRFLAKRLGLAGTNEWETLEIDIQVDNLNDLRADLASFTYEKHEEAKNLKKEEVLTNRVPYILTRLEKQVENNRGHFVNGKLSWADIWFTGMFEYLNYMAGKNIFESYPKLLALREKVLKLPQLQKYLKSRPEVPV